jgi:hypothetical protein
MKNKWRDVATSKEQKKGEWTGFLVTAARSRRGNAG